ncbi:MAG: hypothetical protein R3330_02270 [Saprospiraceae bacterium]|nr:hypothetical protein [Saprospiraceae bacterium]
MAEITTPFNYREILIGEEILYRALLQQEQHAQSSHYGATWSDQDQVEKSSAYFKANVLRTDFAIPAEFQHCVPYPPCPWKKEEHEVAHDQFKPVVMAASGIYTFEISVHRRTDSGNQSFSVGARIIGYTLDASALEANIRSEFAYYRKDIVQPDATGAAVVVMKRFHRGNPDHQFHYLFDLIK